jgi:hypothetical protein
MKLVILLNWVIALYFFLLANFYFWGHIFALIVSFSKPESSRTFFSLFNIIMSPFLMWGAITFLRKSRNKYNYGLVIIALIFIISEVYRFFFVTNYQLEKADLTNLLFDGIPFLAIYLTKYLDSKYS